MPDPITEAVKILNDALDRDPDAMTRLVDMRVTCNEKLAAHPTIQVFQHGDEFRLGILGLLNGALGGGPSGDIGARGTVDPATGQFKKIKQFVDLRTEKLDVLA